MNVPSSCYEANLFTIISIILDVSSIFIPGPSGDEGALSSNEVEMCQTGLCE